MRSVLRFAMASLSIAVGCSSGGGSTAPSPCANNRCDSSKPSGPTHGVRSDGRVDVTAADAWPGRPNEPAALTPQQLAQTCVALAACLDPSTSPATLTGLCVLPDGSEERAIPSSLSSDVYNERRSFVFSSALAGKNDCATLNALDTKRDNEIVCEEDGCWWSSNNWPIPTVSCAGDVAQMVTNNRTIVRDCARAWQKCDPTSPTGCTDRHTTGCDPKGTDRCDGDIKLGCSGNGRVSFHDCTRVAGGHCQEKSADTAACVYLDAAKCTAGSASTCTTDGKVSVCVGGDFVLVDCTTIGWSKCNGGVCAK